MDSASPAANRSVASASPITSDESMNPTAGKLSLMAEDANVIDRLRLLGYGGDSVRNQREEGLLRWVRLETKCLV